MVGTTLLDDKSGTIIPAIAEQYGNNAERINMEILRRWLQGKGISDRTWQGLLGVLRVHCVALAESVEEVLTEKEVSDPRPTGQLTGQLDHPPPPSGAPRRYFQSLRNLFKRQVRLPHADLPHTVNTDIPHPPHADLPRHRSPYDDLPPLPGAALTRPAQTELSCPQHADLLSHKHNDQPCPSSPPPTDQPHSCSPGTKKSEPSHPGEGGGGSP